MVVRRRRQRPPDFARSSTCVETIKMPEIEDPAERFLSWIDYYGIAEVEFKFDHRDGTYKLLDVNPRTWGSHSIGGRAGVEPHILFFNDRIGGTVVRRAEQEYDGSGYSERTFRPR